MCRARLSVTEARPSRARPPAPSSRGSVVGAGEVVGPLRPAQLSSARHSAPPAPQPPGLKSHKVKYCLKVLTVTCGLI